MHFCFGYKLLFWFLVASGLLAARNSPIYPELWVHDQMLLSPKAAALTGASIGFNSIEDSISMGGLPIPFPFELSKERGGVLHNPLPVYSHQGGWSEWGRGWNAALRIYRYTDSGEVDCRGELFASPWGRLKQSSRPGVFFPAGYEPDIEITKNSTGFTGFHSDGTVFEFSQSFGDYAWYLTRVVSKQGYRTELFYKLNEHGRPLLKTVQYGGKRHHQYEVEFLYERLNTPIKLYESCALNASVTERVSKVILKHWDGSQFITTKTAVLKHRDGYLEEIIQKFSDASELPPIKYSYDGVEKYLAKPFKMSKTNFTDVMLGLRNRNFYSTTVSYFDFNQDGIIDIERGDDLRSFILNDEGQFTPRVNAEPFSPEGACRWWPEWGRRLISRLGGPESEPSYLFLRNDADVRGTNTHLVVCSLDGKPRYEKKIFDIFRSGFSFSDTTHLVDMNRDSKADLVRVDKNGITVFLNESTSSEIKFSDKIWKPLSSLHYPNIKSFFLVDINGDHFIDLVAQVQYGLLIWHGRENLNFDESPIQIRFQSLHVPDVELSPGELTFVDLNRDGLVDCILTLYSEPFLFINEGNRFYRKPFPGFKNLPTLIGYPRLFNFNGTLDEQLSLWAPSTGMIYYDLNGPSTGLLTRVDNGQGIVLDFEYQWTKPKPGVPKPFIVPKSTSVSIAGKGTQKTEYEFIEPKVNLATGQLLGFGKVKTKGAQISVLTDYLTSTEHSPRPVGVHKQDDRVPGIIEAETYEWRIDILNGIFYPKLVQTVQSYISKGEQIVRRSVDFLDYDRLCVNQTRETTAIGILEKLVSYFDSRACLKVNHTLVGPDFSYTTLIDYNQAGLPTNLELAMGRERLPKMALGYDEEFNLKNVTEPGRGTTFLYYDPVFEILSSLQFPDSTWRKMTRYSAHADAISGLLSKGSSSEPLNQTFAYDGFYRLNQTSNSLDHESRYSYRLPNQTTPGLLFESIENTVALSSADGEPMSNAKQTEGSWYFEPLHRKLWSQSKEQQLDLAFLNRNPEELRFEDFEAAGAVLTETKMSDVFGVLSKESAVSANRRNYVQHQFEIGINGLKTISKENKQYVTESLTDLSSSQPIRFTNELNQIYDYERDVLGRLRKITLPDGNTQTVTFDGFGRVSNISRSNVGDVIYTYDNAGGHLIQKTILGENETYGYDEAGRMGSMSRGKESFKFSYEGSAVSRVEHADFTKEFSYTPDNKASCKQLKTKAGLSIGLTYQYDRFGNLVEHGVSGRYAKHFVHDDYRQLGLVRIGSQTFSIKRNKQGKVSAIALPNNQTLYVDYDSLTQSRTGYSSNQGSYHWNLNDRGLIESTHFSSSVDTCDPMMLSFVYADDKTLQSEPTSADAVRLGKRVSGLYDENRHRIGKYKDGRLEHIRFEGVVATSEHIYEKFSIEGIDLGILIDGKFQPCLFDQVGSLIAIGDLVSIPSPFGQRAEYASIFEYFDYAGHGRDPETGLIAMGERNYDPATHQFTSPDRYFLENPDECIRSPQECDLFSYAKNNPLIFKDSTGRMSLPVRGIIAVGFAANSAYQFYKEQSVENAVSLGVSLVGSAALRSGPVLKKISDVKDVASNVVSGKRLADQLRLESAKSPFRRDGYLTKKAIDDSEIIIPSEKIGNQNIPRGFDKMGTESFQSPSGDFRVHFYQNEKTGKVFYDQDYKVKFNLPLKGTK